MVVEHRRLPPPRAKYIPASAGGLPAPAEAGRVASLLACIFVDDPARRPTMATVCARGDVRGVRLGSRVPLSRDV